MRAEARVARAGLGQWASTASRLVLGLDACLLLLYLVAFVRILAELLSYPYPLHFEEGLILNAARTALHGGNIYPAAGGVPYMGTVYPPLHYLLFAPGVALFGTNLVPARLVALVSTLLLAILVYRWIAWRTGGRLAALLASGALLTFFPISNWVAVVRSDTAAVLMAMLGVYLVDRYSGDRRSWLAIPLMVLAFYTKQTLLAAPLAVGIYLLVAGRWRKAIAFGGGYLALMAVVFAAVELATQNGWGEHLLYNQGNAVWLWRGIQLYKSYFLSYGGYIIVAGMGALFLLFRLRASLPAIYLGTSFLGTWSIIGTGSDYNHFMESAAVVCLLAGMGLAGALSHPRPLLGLAVATIFMAQLALRSASVVPAVPNPWIVPPDYSGRGVGIGEPPLWSEIPTLETRQTGERLVSEFAAAMGPVISELSGFEVLAGRTPLVDDFFMYKSLTQIGKWSEEPLLGMIESRRIVLIALLIDVRPAGVHHTRLTDRAIEAIRANYRLDEVLPFPGPEGPRFYLYRPLQPSDVAAN